MHFNLKDIAKKAQTSISTVSFILNGKGEQHRISQKTINKVIDISKEYNYRPNETARSLRLKKSKTIGFILSLISNPFFAELAQSIEEEASKNNYTIIIGNSNENEKIENEILNNFISRSVDGIILSSLKMESKTLNILNELKIPHVFLDRTITDQKSICIGSDNYNGAIEGLNYLLENGCKNIVFIGGNKSTPTSIERKKAYIDFLKKNNLINNSQWIKEKEFSYNWGYEAAKEILENNNQVRPDAVFSTSWFTTGGYYKIY